jgi:large subunit ribosomal protein L17
MLKRKLGRESAHRTALFRNMVTSLFDKEKIETTETKAKEARMLAEKMITLAKKGDLNSRRLAAEVITDPEVLQKLFSSVAGRYANRNGGYTRILKIGPTFGDTPGKKRRAFRRGDAAPMVILELVQ